MFTKNKRGLSINNRFCSLLILLLSVAFIRRTLLKTTFTDKRLRPYKFRKLQYSDHKKINLISNTSFTYYNLSSSIIFRRILIYSKYFIIFVICFIYNALKTIFSARCLCHGINSKHREERHLAVNYFGV